MTNHSDQSKRQHPLAGDEGRVSRRQFLEAAGFTLAVAAAGGCGRAPTVTALPFDTHPEGMVPGRSQWYASTCLGCTAGCGLLVGVRDGRPLKMEGMPEHPLSRGGLCAIGQALPLGLYDSTRLANPLQNGEKADWDGVDESITTEINRIAASGGSVRFVTGTITSPTLQAMIDEFLDQFDNAKHIVFDTVSSSAILAAHERTHQAAVLPHYRFDEAEMIVSFGADFLATWISPVEFTAGWSSKRSPTDDHPEMSYHVQLEGRMSLTGANADRRFRVAPDQYGGILSQLAVRIAKLAKQDAPAGTLAEPTIDPRELDELAERLWTARGKSLIVSDSQDIDVQSLVNYLNHLLENYGVTLDIKRPSRQRQGRDAEVQKVVQELLSGSVDALFVAGVDLTHCLPKPKELAEAIESTKLVVSFADRVDDFSSHADFVCPSHHALESWRDAEPVTGLVTLAQPTLEPLQGTRSILESLARFSGRDDSAYDIVRETWRNLVMTRSDATNFQAFWDQALHDGFVEVASESTPEGEIQPVELCDSGKDDNVLVLYCKTGLTDSYHAHNPWLQELPDPVTKVTWDNYVCLSPATAKELDVTHGDILRIDLEQESLSVELPAFVQTGQHDRVFAIALNYGVRGTDRFADIGPQWLEGRPTVEPGELVGKNAAGFIDLQDDSLRYERWGVRVTKTSDRREFASTQRYDSLKVPAHIAPHGAESRPIVQQTTLPEFIKDPHAGTPEVHHDSDQQLWPEDHPKGQHYWGMVIDMNACTGCSACLIACQAENNVPVVGRDEVQRQREMHWIRIDRYYSGPPDDLTVHHQPMMCQHCGNAPCETVCPVLATIHGEEGLNQQAYNRCVGTRYCANNCPYKVRRFNWFKYEMDDPLQTLALNPDVTVRTRGVMEKCSMCVQRIEQGKIAARERGELVADGDIQTACQQSCPAQAITFGDTNDPDSQVRLAAADPRTYMVFEEFNFRPSVAYKRVVENRVERDGDEDGGHESQGESHA